MADENTSSIIAENRDALAAVWRKVTTAYPPPVSREGETPDPREVLSLGDWIVGELRARDEELLRLAGPICALDQRRAVEHEIAPHGWVFANDVKMKLDGEKHPAWPVGKKWLQKHEGRYE